MKRIGLLAIIGCSVSGVAIAAGVDCNVVPSCAEMGFDKTVAECGESKVLRCPFDLTNDDAVFCSSGCTTGGGCDELFTLETCPTNGICAECGGKFILHSCESGYINGVDKCCNRSEYSLLQCPEGGECSSCGDMSRLESCGSGYTQSGMTCCSNTTYNLDTCPDGATCAQCGAKYSYTGCQSGYTQSGTTCCSDTIYSLSSCPTNAESCSQCGSKYKVNSCETNYAGTDCSSCTSGYAMYEGVCTECYNSCADAGYGYGDFQDTYVRGNCFEYDGNTLCAHSVSVLSCSDGMKYCTVIE